MVSEDYVVWVDRTLPEEDGREMYVYDLRAGREVRHQVATGRFFNLAGEVLAWQEYRGPVGIYGQHLTTGEHFTVTTRSASYPRVAGDWVAYLSGQGMSVEEAEHLRADRLYLFNWRTGEERLIGRVPVIADGGGYALDEEHLAWVKVQTEVIQQQTAQRGDSRN